jgi:hypothetical protein
MIEQVDNQIDMKNSVSKNFPYFTHRITLLFYANWWTKWGYD